MPAQGHVNAGDVDFDLVVPPARIDLPPQLLLPFAGGVLLLLFLPLGGKRRLGVRISVARSASPVVLLAGCGSDPAVRVYHVDHLGSTQVVTDYQGNLYRQVRYFAYGEIRGRFNSAGNPASAAEDARFEFTGYETDFAGLDYAGARFFDPELAQFGSHDPAGQYASPYAYGPGDPINGTDPGGECWECAVVYAAVQQIATAIDTYNQTGSSSKASLAGIETVADQVTGGVYGAVKSYRAGESGQYMEAYALNQATGGVYGTVQAFNNGQTASGVVGALSIAFAAYEIRSQVVSGNEVASGNEVLFADNSATTDVATPMTGTILNSLPESPTLFQRVVNGVIDVVSTALVVGDLILGGLTGEGIIPAMGIQVFRLGGKQAAKQAAKETFRKEAGGLTKRVIRDSRADGTGRIRGVGAGRASYRPKPDGSYSVTPQSGRAADTLHFLP